MIGRSVNMVDVGKIRIGGPDLVLIAGLREQLAFAQVPKVVKGTALTLLIAGRLSLTFMGFAGLGTQ